MTNDEMRRYLEHLAQLPDDPDLPEDPEEESGGETEGEVGGGGQVQVEVVSGPPGLLRRVYTKGLWFAGLPELFADPPPDFVSGEEDQARLAFLLASALISLGQDLVQAESFDVEAHHDVFRGRPVRLWLTRPEPPDEGLRVALGSEVDTVIRVECSLWAEESAGKGGQGDEPR